MALLLCPEMITALVDVDSCRKILVMVILKMCVTLSLSWKHEYMFHNLCKLYQC